jgi:hypothetical protein
MVKRTLWQTSEQLYALKGHDPGRAGFAAEGMAGFIDGCISNILATAPEAQCSLAPRFSVGRTDSTWELRSPVGTVQDIPFAGINSP